MKKPFIWLKSPFDILKFVICILLCVYAISLFNSKESIAVFSGGNNSPNSLYGLAGSFI